jgi:acetyl esterase/lipase
MLRQHRSLLFKILPLLLLISTACGSLVPQPTVAPTQQFVPPSTPSLTQTPRSPTATATPSFDAARLGTVERDLIYCTPNGIELKMDIYFPASDGPWPALVNIHGGGWTEGGKGSVDASMTARGFLVVSINYRLYPEARFPAMIQDVKCAIRSLRAHAAYINLDPQRIGLIGHSAGGHLAALAALADESAGFDVGEYLDQSSRVQAVLVNAGPVDLTRPFPNYLRRTIGDVFGQEQLVSGSPITYITPDDPPFIILHGDLDKVVPPEQSQILYERLIAVGVRAQLFFIHNADHNFDPVGGALSPSWDDLTQITTNFWMWNLH